MKNVARLVPLLVALACGDKVAATSPTTTVPPTTTITFPGATLSAEIAASAAARDQGLMGRTSLGANAGMLFVYADDLSPQLVGFWMKDTPIDLSIAFLDASQKVINVDEMTKNTLNTHVAKANFRYAIEASAGWFTAHGIAAGTTASFSLPAGTVISP
jgi:uncharacterized membrane protein (UPF0127 family)